jgi:hypothetical protein
MMKAAPRGAPGTYEHIKAATTSSEDAPVAVLRLVQAMVRGDLPYLPLPL